MALLTRIIAILFVCSAMTIFSGCDGNGASSDLPLQDNTDDENTGDDGDQNSSVSEEFFVTLNDYDESFYVTTNGTFNQDCAISSTASSSEDLICIFDVLEFDSYVQSMDLQYNVPAEMCEYVTSLPSYHWNQSVGYGPTNVTLVFTDGEIDTSNINECSITEQDGTTVACDSAIEIRSVDTSGPNCIYDRSEDDSNLLNCCFGTYESNITAIDTAASSTIVTAADDADWGGGDLGSCMGGGSEGGWGVFSSTESIPVRAINEVDADGVNLSLPLASNASQLQSGFSYQINWAENSSGEHDHTGYGGTGSSTLPYAFEPINDLDETTVFSTNHPYLFECWDSARERIHRIRVYLREWNTLTEFLAYGTSSGNSSDYDPHVFGIEGTDCGNDAWDGNDGCNDYSDFQDILVEADDGTQDGTINTYDTTTPDATVRTYWFPNIVY